MGGSSSPPTDRSHRYSEETLIGVDVGVRNLVAAAPADGDVTSAFVVDGGHLRKRYELLAETTRALEGAPFDTTDGQIQLFAAIWYQIRPQVYDAAVRVVRYARQFTAPTIVLEDLGSRGAPLWERRTTTHLDTWLLPALQHAVRVKADYEDVAVTTVDPRRTTRQCHTCGEVGSVDGCTLSCTTPDCPTNTAPRDASAALSIARRATLEGSG